MAVKVTYRPPNNKGFSLKEIKEAGLTPEEAKKLGIAVDKRRKSLNKTNVELLKEYIKSIESKK
ncbi:hypothetical protein DRN73_08435 [Candidatus Pacearchaeota archaeon]|nr:MAG: hypothetical protein DRN73_08435 [Candidatus Pacearchaeota archaeon]